MFLKLIQPEKRDDPQCFGILVCKKFVEVFPLPLGEGELHVGTSIVVVLMRCARGRMRLNVSDTQSAAAKAAEGQPQSKTCRNDVPRAARSVLDCGCPSAAFASKAFSDRQF